MHFTLKLQTVDPEPEGVYYPDGFTNLCEPLLKVGITMDSKMTKL